MKTWYISEVGLGGTGWDRMGWVDGKRIGEGRKEGRKSRFFFVGTGLGWVGMGWDSEWDSLGPDGGQTVRSQPIPKNSLRWSFVREFAKVDVILTRVKLQKSGEVW